MTTGAVVGERPDGAVASSGVAVGYMREHLLMSETELAAVERDLADCAQRHGCVLGTVHVERIDQSPAAFQALVNQLVHQDIAVLILPGAHHLAVLGSPPELLMTHLENTTGARVLIARHSP